MTRRITFEKLSDYLYDVKIDGRESELSVYWEAGWFYCSYPGQFKLCAKTLEQMREEIQMEIE